ncbi:15938_t:CDS:2 [Cetraspora pellucida]|uniref:15938_t:CDS:1 n=1 Tax=Cetraspora pellucida TaxID=1433469 RepID=A0A9N8WNS9_9GLOM|nr:15938_t:CDS:2 [Cetraspora pellucida]
MVVNAIMVSRDSNNSKFGCPQTGVWKFFERGQSKDDAHLANSCKKVPKEWRYHFNNIIVNNLEDIPTDEPISNASSSLVKQKNIAKQPGLTNWYDSIKIKTPMQSLIDKAILLAFLLNPGYNIPSREVLSGHLLDSELAKVIHKVDGILKYTNNLTIDLDGWTAPNDPVILTILCGRGFFTNLQYLSDVLFPIKEAILAVEANRSTLADCYINLVKIAAAIQNLAIDEYKGFHNESYKGLGLKFDTFPFIANYARKLWQQMTLGWIYRKHQTRLNIDQLEELAKIYQFNLSNSIEQLHHTQTAEINPEIMTNIAETVFKEFEEETLIEDDDIEMLNPAKNLYPNKQDLDLSISASIDFKSLVFMFSNSYESRNFNEIESDNDIQEGKYNVDKIVAAELNYSSH